jgi:Asp-tRNA(Asn)/Glu-tRNA(Gln) amidotransferase A subunit family amidase
LRNLKTLRIGVVRDDGLFTTTPPVKRGMEEAVRKLANAGVAIVEMKLPAIMEALPVFWELLAVNGWQVRRVASHLDESCNCAGLLTWP